MSLILVTRAVSDDAEKWLGVGPRPTIKERQDLLAVALLGGHRAADWGRAVRS